MRYDDQLALLREKMARREQLKIILKELDEQRKNLALRVEDLEWIKRREEYDVARMEGKSLSAFLYTLIGGREKKLDRERAELCAAVAKYQAAQTSLEQVKEEILSAEAELATLTYCHEEYDRLLQKKRDAIKATGSADGQEILEIEQRIAFLLHQEKEAEEARRAGESALEIAEKICRHLGSAKGHAYVDVIGGGMMVDYFKHDQLIRAQNRVEALQNALRSFQVELADISAIPVQEQFRLDGFLEVADVFFDCIFVDWDVYSEIKDSEKNMIATRDKIKEALARLETLKANGEKEMEEWKARLKVLEERNPL